SQDDVREAVAFGMPDARLGEVVAAAVVLRPGAVADERALQEFVAARLAGFKVPVRIVVTDRLARNSRGQLLPGRLATLHGLDAPLTPVERPPFVAPRTATESVLALMWEKVLAVEGIGVDDDFFALGGTSLLCSQLFEDVEAKFGHRYPLGTIVRA